MKFIEICPKHIEFIQKWHNDKEINNKVGFEREQTLEETKELLKSFVVDDNRKFFMIEHNEETIGYVTLSSINKIYQSADLHTLIGEKKYLGTKVCVDTIDEILKYAFTKLGLYRVTTYVMGNNSKLIKTARKYGWTEEGIMKEAIVINNQRINYHIFRMLQPEFIKNRRISCQ